MPGKFYFRCGRMKVRLIVVLIFNPHSPAPIDAAISNAVLKNSCASLKTFLETYHQYGSSSAGHRVQFHIGSDCATESAKFFVTFDRAVNVPNRSRENLVASSVSMVSCAVRRCPGRPLRAYLGDTGGAHRSPTAVGGCKFQVGESVKAIWLVCVPSRKRARPHDPTTHGT